MTGARIYRSGKKEFECKLVDTGEMVTASALGNLLKNANIVIGDYVVLEVSGNEKKEFQIVEIEKRQNEIFRVSIIDSKRKVTAANCDLMVILSSVSRPEYNRGMVDRFLVRSQQWGIKAVVVFNKMDEFKEGMVDVSFERDRLKPLGVDCYELAALNPGYTNRYLSSGYNELKLQLKDETTIFLGESGVGKSSTISSLSNGKVDLRTKEIDRAGKGTHTTTWSEIVDCGDFSLIDSPGIRSVSLEDMDPEEFINYFPDLFDIASNCKFNNCRHTENNKGCAFFALDSSLYENQLILSRLDSYRSFLEEISIIPYWQKKLLNS